MSHPIFLQNDLVVVPSCAKKRQKRPAFRRELLLQPPERTPRKYSDRLKRLFLNY